MSKPVAKSAPVFRVSVCICTYRRPEQLTQLLDTLAAQFRVPDQVIVVDNDGDQSALPVCQSRDDAYDLIYDHEPEQNISLARNRTLSYAEGEWIGFLDDDEVAPADWLQLMLGTAAKFKADGVLAPVISEVPDDAPRWIRKGDFFGRERYATGTVVPANQLRIGNALIKRSCIRCKDAPFDPDFGLSGGEDGRLLSSLAAQGARFVWCDEAVVTEPVEPKRLRLSWILMRALRGGQDYGLHFLSGAYGPVGSRQRGWFAIKAVAVLLMCAPLALLSGLLGRHRAVHWLKKAYAQMGKILAFSSYRYQEYKAGS